MERLTPDQVGIEPIVLVGARCRLRAFRETDADDLARLANDYSVAQWMTAGFPHPYDRVSAREWLAKRLLEFPPDYFAVEVDGDLAGGSGIEPRTGERSGVAEFGYWLGRAYWGRGIATELAQLLASYALSVRRLRRLEAHVFAPNAASVRVLEKSGFVREAVLRDSYVQRDGTVCDGLLYARLAGG